MAKTLTMQNKDHWMMAFGLMPVPNLKAAPTYLHRQFALPQPEDRVSINVTQDQRERIFSMIKEYYALEIYDAYRMYDEILNNQLKGGEEILPKNKTGKLLTIHTFVNLSRVIKRTLPEGYRTKRRNEKIVRLFKSGKSKEELAKLFGMSTHSMQGLLVGFGVITKRKSPTYTDKNMRRAA